MNGSGNSLSIVLDTSAYSHFRAGHDGVLNWIAGALIVILPTVVLGELEAGFLLGTRRRENQIVLNEFLDEPFVKVMPVTQDVARKYGAFFAALRRQGTPIPVNDIWIAACASCANAQLITFDRDFEFLPELECSVLKDSV